MYKRHLRLSVLLMLNMVSPFSLAAVRPSCGTGQTLWLSLIHIYDLTKVEHADALADVHNERHIMLDKHDSNAKGVANLDEDVYKRQLSAQLI